MIPWYAIQVRSGLEARSQQALERKGCEVYLPTYIDCKQYSDRVKKVAAPLFPGYLFGRIDIDYRLPILTTPGVLSIVGFGGVACPVDEAELEAVRAVTTSGVSAMPWPYLKTGDRVRVVYGTLSGAEGLLVRTRGEDRLVLSVHLLQRSISVEIDRTWVKPIEVAPATLKKTTPPRTVQEYPVTLSGESFKGLSDHLI
jgi:transcription antitermination factor NusG